MAQLPPAPLRPDASRSRAERLAESLDQRIRAEHLTEGAFLGTLDSLRTDTGLARATVSEAARLLRDRGMVEIRPGRTGGLFVAPSSPVVRLRHTLLSLGDRPTAVIDAIELREHLEELVDAGAARHRTASDVVELRRALAAMAAADDWAGFLRANWALHERIARVSPNAVAGAVYIGTLGQLAATSATVDAVDSEAYRAERFAVHVELVDAIASGDLDEVRRAVARHNDGDRAATDPAQE